MADVPFIPFHAKARVQTADPAKAPTNGRSVRIAGKTKQPNKDGRYGCGVVIYDLARAWCCNEAKLEVSGEFDDDAIRIPEQQRLRLAAKYSG